MGAEADRILFELRVGSFRLTRHAKERMDERGVTPSDIRRCAETVRSVEEQDNGKHLITGRDISGDELQVVAVWDGETVVITVMGD